MAQALNLDLVMRTLMVVAVVLALTGCRGEPVPRDYQNAPPDIGNAAQSRTDTPSAGASGEATPQPSTGAEGTMGSETSGATTMPDTPPVTTTT